MYNYTMGEFAKLISDNDINVTYNLTDGSSAYPRKNVLIYQNVFGFTRRFRSYYIQDIDKFIKNSKHIKIKLLMVNFKFSDFFKSWISSNVPSLKQCSSRVTTNNFFVSPCCDAREELLREYRNSSFFILLDTNEFLFSGSDLEKERERLRTYFTNMYKPSKIAMTDHVDGDSGVNINATMAITTSRQINRIKLMPNTHISTMGIYTDYPSNRESLERCLEMFPKMAQATVPTVCKAFQTVAGHEALHVYLDNPSTFQDGVDYGLPSNARTLP